MILDTVDLRHASAVDAGADSTTYYYTDLLDTNEGLKIEGFAGDVMPTFPIPTDPLEVLTGVSLEGEFRCPNGVLAFATQDLTRVLTRLYQGDEAAGGRALEASVPLSAFATVACWSTSYCPGSALRQVMNHMWELRIPGYVPARSLLLRVCGSCSLPPLADDAGDVVDKMCILEYNHKKPNIVSARLEGNSV